MGKHDVLWTTTDRTARELGNICKNYKHIMQLMELIEDMPLFPGQKIFKAKLDRIGRSAYQVVVPEYNRAQILATWWNLKKIPYILPNKPACMELDIKMPEEYVGIIEKVKSEKRKIVIYQGVIREERPLDCFIEAVEELGKDYCVYIMGEESEELKRLITKYPGIEHIPFIRPPFHLIATQYAHIGILSYVPYKDKKLHYSDLNALYCAPNKIYEYAGIGLPMIGNNIPGLKYTVEMWGMGQLFNGFSRREIANTIRKIEENYDEYKENCYKFYHDLSLDSIVKEILNDENDISE